jgi:hypothetical protein
MRRGRGRKRMHFKAASGRLCTSKAGFPGLQNGKPNTHDAEEDFSSELL